MQVTYMWIDVVITVNGTSLRQTANNPHERTMNITWHLKANRTEEVLLYIGSYNAEETALTKAA
jgi:hypothetical protein